MVRHLALAAAAWLALTSGAAGAIAQGRDARSGDKKEAVRRLAAGDRKLARGDKLAARGKIEQAFAEFEAALAEYNAAYQAYADAQIFFPIAQAEQRLGRYLDALQHYQQLLAHADQLTAQVKSQVQVQLNEVKKNLAAVVLEVEPAGAVIRVDGREVARSPMSQPVFVEPGTHTLGVARSGFKTIEEKVDLAPGKELRRRIRLEQVTGTVEKKEPPVVPPVVEPRPREPEPERPSAVPVWIGVGLTGALVIGGTATGFAALSKHGQFRDDALDETAREEARRDGKQLAGITDIVLGGALVAAGVTTYYYLWVYRPRAARAERLEPDEVEGPEEALQVAPLLGDGVAGVAAWVRF